MEVEGLVPKQDTKVEETFTRWSAFTHELNRVNCIALPMIIVTVSQYLLRVSPMFMLGHSDELSFSSASIATSICNVTGFSVLLGMSSALETLCGQAYGAGEHKKVGIFTYGAIISLLLICVPISILWIFTEKLLLLIGQDPLISEKAGKFAMQLIPTLFSDAILQCLVRYLQTQNLVFPMIWSALASLLLQLGLCWALIFKLYMGNSGATISIAISYWLNVILIMLYVKYSSACSETRASFSMEVFVAIREFFQFAIPSASMICLEWWVFEFTLLLSGILPNPQLQSSVLSICFTIALLHNHVPVSFGASASTLISNELGAGRPESAQLAMQTVLSLSIAESLIASLIVISCAHILGYAFVEEKVVVVYVEKMAPFLGLYIISDSLQTVLSGVSRGTGRQDIGAYINFGAYYAVGVPVTLLLGFVLHLGAQGLWTGLLLGSILQCIALSIVARRTNWEKEAMRARLRIFSGKLVDLDEYI